MRQSLIYLLFIFATGLPAKAQTTRFFEFTTTCGHGNWQDSSFIAATSDQVVIDSVLANLSRPLMQRNFISGQIDYGNGGHNHNSSHWFLWHFIPNQWNLVELAMEICDGCPYSDVDADTAYWVGTIGQFCPWSGRSVREVADPLSVQDDFFDMDIRIYPNPAKDEINISRSVNSPISVSIINCLGQELNVLDVNQQTLTIRLAEFSPGLYFLRIPNGKQSVIKRLIIE